MALGLLTVAASLAVERLLPAVCASGVGVHRLPCYGAPAPGCVRFRSRGAQASLAVERLLLAVCASGIRRTGFLALRHVGSSQTRGKTCVPSTAPPGKSLDSIFLKELTLVSEGKYRSGKWGHGGWGIFQELL